MARYKFYIVLYCIVLYIYYNLTIINIFTYRSNCTFHYT